MSAATTNDAVKVLPTFDPKRDEVKGETDPVQQAFLEKSGFKEELDIESLVKDHANSPGRGEVALGIVMLSLWILFFVIGSFVPTEPLRNALLGGQGMNPLVWIGHTLVVIFCYTLTNIFFLTQFSAILGCMTVRWRVVEHHDSTMKLYSSIKPIRLYFAAILRAFFLYAAMISGLLILSTSETISKTTFDQYIRMAGFASIFGFMIGYDPNLIYKMMGKVTDLANKPLGLPKSN